MDSDTESESSLEDKPLTEVLSAAELIATTSQEPLEAVGASHLVVQDEVTKAVEYARNYFSIETEQYPQGVVQALRFPRRYQTVKCPSPLRTVFQPSILKWQCGTNVQTCQD